VYRRASLRSSGDGSRPMTLRTFPPYRGRFNPDPIPISSTRPSAAPTMRSRNGRRTFCRIVKSSIRGST
jgi:hypothetical protein